ncbi:hypothetical protein [Treponema zioleckii]|uniref:hypothetical protein n=1 Tax=Treponema zioleckii TaxID=331680 RepID=UPI00168B778D|nr:hypothetical protein [Treponema zioleckii]
MKKYITILLGALSVLFISGCQSNNPLTGKWQASYKIRNGMERPEEKGNIVLYLNIEQKIEYVFTSKNFSKKITQNLSSIEKVDEFTLPKSEDEIAKEFASEITINGSYNLYGDNINFFAETVTLPDGNEMDFQDYQDLNPTIGDEEYHEEFSINGDKMKLGGVEFKKIVEK